MTIDETISHALEVAEEQSRLYSLCPFPCDGMKNCMSLIDMPAADVQSVKHGRWDGYICSECNVCADYFISGDFYFDEKPNFCPNCGARMIQEIQDGDTNG